jgi:hypothetical protein
MAELIYIGVGHGFPSIFIIWVDTFVHLAAVMMSHYFSYFKRKKTHLEKNGFFIILGASCYVI